MKIPLYAGTWADPGPVIAWAEVDEEDFAGLAQHRWHLNPYGYAARTGRRDIPPVCPDCGWLAKPGQHAGRSMANHRAKMHGVHTQGRRHTILMHRAILGLQAGDRRQGDHMNRNRLDNRRDNLRIISSAGNAQNRNSQRTMCGIPTESSYRGVYKVKKRGKWTGRWKAIVANHYLGCFATEEAAAKAASDYRIQTMEHALD